MNIFIENRILHVVMSQPELAERFGRCEEFYEGPEGLRGNINSLEAIDSFYRQYIGVGYEAWEGFNFPKNVFEEFKTKTPLTELEKELDVGDVDYIIGYLPEDVFTANHELSHALFYMNEDYRKESSFIVHSYLVEGDVCSLFDSLRKEGYGEEVLLDEVIAYSVSCFEEVDYLTEKDKNNFFLLSSVLRPLFLEYIRGRK